MYHHCNAIDKNGGDARSLTSKQQCLTAALPMKSKHIPFGLGVKGPKKPTKCEQMRHNFVHYNFIL